MAFVFASSIKIAIVYLNPESSMSQPTEIKVRRGDKIRGPFTSEQIRQLSATGQLHPTDEVCRDGKWLTLADFLALESKSPPTRRPLAAASLGPSSSDTHVPRSPLLQSKHRQLDFDTGSSDVEEEEVLGGAASSASELLMMTLLGLAVSGLGGVFGDFFTPITPWNFVFGAGAAFCSLILLTMYLAFRNRGLARSALCVLCISIGFSAWWLLAEFTGSGERGLLASKIRRIGEYQDKFLSKWRKGSSVEAAKNLSGFNAEDFRETLKWLNAIRNRDVEIENPLVWKEVVEKERSELAKINGVDVQWQFPVADLGVFSDAGPYRGKPYFRLDVRPSSGIAIFFNVGQSKRQGACSECFFVDDDVSAEKYKKLKSGSHVTIKGKVRFEVREPVLFIHIENATVK